jgi:hypothetical protein
MLSFLVNSLFGVHKENVSNINAYGKEEHASITPKAKLKVILILKYV